MRLGRQTTAAVIAVSCIVLAVLYAVLAPPLGYQIEWAGVTMLIALGAAIGIMYFALYTGQGE